MKTTRKRRLWSVVAALVVVLFFYGCGSEPDPFGSTADQAYDAGRRLQSAGQLEDASKAYKTSLERNPKFLLARYNLALVLLERNMPGQALGEMNKVVEMDPKLSGAHATIAEIKLELGEHESALMSADNALKLENELVEALQVRAVALDKLGRNEDALRAYGKLADVGGNSRVHRIRAAELQHALGNTAQAMNELKGLVAQFPKDPQARLAQGRYFYNVRQYQSAIDALDEALLLEGLEDVVAGEMHLLIGRSFLKSERPKQALISLGKAKKIAPELADIYVALGETELDRGYGDRASNYVNEALEKDPQLVGAYLLKAMIFEKDNDLVQMEAMLEEVAKREPNNYDASLMLARRYLATNKNAEAAKLLEMLNSSGTINRKLQSDLVKAYIGSGQTVKALPILVGLTRMNQNPSVAELKNLINLGLANPGKGMSTEELVEFADQHHQRLGGEDADALLLLVDALVANGQKDRAVETLKASLKKFRTNAKVKARYKELLK